MIYDKIANMIISLFTFLYESCNEYIVTTFIVLLSYISNPPTEKIDVSKIAKMVSFFVLVSGMVFIIPYVIYKRESAAKTGEEPKKLSGKNKEYYDMYMTSLMWCGITVIITLLFYFIHYLKQMDYISIPYISNSSVRLVGLGGIGAGITSLWVFSNSLPFLDIKRSMI